MAKRQSIQTFDLDLRRFQPPRERPLLYGMHVEAWRIAITRLVVEHVVDACDPHPVTGRPVLNAHRLWHVIRALPVDEHTNVEQALQHANTTLPVDELGRIAALVLGLRERRALLQQQLELLDELEAAFAARDETP